MLQCRVSSSVGATQHRCGQPTIVNPMFCGKSRSTLQCRVSSSVRATQHRCGQPSVVSQMFYNKSHVAHYTVEFHRVWGLPNTSVDNLPSLLECFAVSRTWNATVFSFTECPSRTSEPSVNGHCCCCHFLSLLCCERPSVVGVQLQ